MKNFKFKWLLLSIVLSIASINTAWAWDCGWWDEGTACITFSINGTDKTLGTVNRNKSDYADHDLGTVTTSLKIKGAWGKNFGQDCLNAMKLHYRVKVRDASSSAAYSEYSLPWKSNFDSNNQCWQKDDINTDININNLSPGNYEVEYYMQIYPKDGKSCQFVCLDNGGSRYHANFTIPSKNLTIATDDTHGSSVSGSVTGVKKGYAYTITATPARGYRFKNWTATSGGSSVTIANSSSASTTVTFNNFSNNVTIKAVFEVKWIFKGSWDSWTADVELGNATGNMRSGTKYLSAGNYGFKIWNRDGGDPYGCNATYTKSEYEYNFYTSHGNCTIQVTTAGTYHFNWDEDNKQLTIIYPDLSEKKILTKNTILYFDARNANASGWKNKDFTARFWFKYFDSGLDHGSVECTKSNSLGVEWMYYAQVPNHDYIGRVQMNRMNPSNLTDIWCSAYIDYAYERTNGDENCLVISSDDAGKCGGFRPGWTYYRPPMSSATLAHDGTKTKTYGGTGDNSTPYLVATESSIYVSATSVSTVDDNQMVPYYQFKKGGANDGSNLSTATHTYTASSTNNTKEAMTVVAQNYYHSAGGTASPASSAIYYEARTPYSVTPTLTHVNKTAGETGASATVYGAVYNATFARTTGYDLPATISVTNGGTPLTVTTDYTWNNSTGVLQIKSGKITGNIAIEITGVAKTTSLTLNPNTANHGTGSNVVTTATFAAALPDFSAAVGATGYELDGYYTTASGEGEKIINANGSLVRNTTYSTDEETPKWNSEVSSLTLHARYTLINYNVTYSAPTNGNYTIQVASGSATSASKIATMGQTIAIVATPVNQAYYFTGWTITNTDASSDVTSTLLPTTSTTASTSFTMPAYNVSITANFAPRFALEGSLYDDSNAAGMPGWVHGSATDFTVAGFTGLGDAGVNLRCTLTTIHPNKKYKFRIYDRERGARLGATSADYLLEANSSVQLSVVGESPANNVVFYSVGYGTYIFHITKLSETNYYPTIEILRQASSQLTLGWKHYTNGTLSDGNTGGTVTAETDEGSGFAITNGQFYANGSTITFTAAPAEGYHVAGWYSDASCVTAYVSGSDGATISGDGDVTLELASVSTNKTVYVKFTEDTKEAVAEDGGWEEKVGDSKITDVVTISSTITVDVAHALAKRVILDQSGDGKAGKLVITANKGLEVAEGIWINNGTSLVAPTVEDLVLESSASGNATLIFNNSNSAAATVQMYSIASVVGSTWNWQYMAPAFTDANALYDYYGSYLYKWNNGGWSAVANGATLDAFAGYCITNKTANSTYVTDGTLVPTTSHSVDLNANEDMVIGNSWTAPIYIGGFTASTFTSTPATIYLFNTGSAKNGSEAYSGEGDPAGTYVTIPVNAAKYTGNELIAPLQAFFVTTVDGSAGTITMNYDELVRTTTNYHSVNAGPMHAPKRVNEEEDPEVMKIWAIGAEYSDRLVILEREDFTTGFDNGWDGEKKSFSDVAPSVYVIAETEKDAVSAVPDYEGTILGFLAGIDTQCTMNFDYNGEENWYLNDLKEEKSTLITNENSYSFSCSGTDAETRFVISRTPIHKVPTGTENVSAGTNARKQMINGVLYVIRDGRIYNAEGALVK